MSKSGGGILGYLYCIVGTAWRLSFFHAVSYTHLDVYKRQVARFAPPETEAEYFSREEAETLLARCFPKRPADSHKGSFGKAGIIAGSFGMCGAAVLAAEACLRMGAGLVTLFIPHDLTGVCETRLREAVKCPMGKSGDEYFTERHLYEILHRIKATNVLVIGCLLYTSRCV